MSAINFTVKFCQRCQSETERYKSGKCIVCSNALSAAWRAANPEKKKVYAKNYFQAHAEEQKEKSALWRQKNPDQVQETLKKYREENREKRNKASAQWRFENLSRVKENFATWYAANPESNRIKAQNRRSRKLGNGGSLSVGLADKLFVLQKGRCACCGLPLGKQYHLDHKVPLVLGGTNTDSNMQLLRKRCNLQKGPKHPVDFMQSRGFLL